MDNFCEKHKLSKVTQEAKDHLNSPVSIIEVEILVNFFSMKKLQVQMASLVNSTEHLRKKYTSSSEILPKI